MAWQHSPGITVGSLVILLVIVLWVWKYVKAKWCKKYHMAPQIELSQVESESPLKQESVVSPGMAVNKLGLMVK